MDNTEYVDEDEYNKLRLPQGKGKVPRVPKKSKHWMDQGSDS